MKYGKYKNENDYLNAEKMYATKLNDALKANDIASVKSIGQEIIQALPYTYRDVFDEVIRDTDSELAKKLQPMDYVAFMHDPKENKMTKDFEYAFSKFGAGPLNSWLDSYADTVLGDGQDHDAYQEFRSLRDDVPEKWAFVKNHEGLSDEEMFDNFINYGYGGEEPMLQVKDVDDHYNGSFVDAGVLSGMLTDTPEIHKATVNWMKGLTGSDLDELNKITSSQTFKDMYGDPDWEGTEQDEYAKGFADVQNSEDPTAPAGKSNRYYDGWNDGLFEKNNTKVGGIAKALTANDLGRSL